jgi:hypothetical protein
MAPLFETDNDRLQREVIEASVHRAEQAAYISRPEARPLQDMRRGRVHRSRDGDAAYVSRAEARPFTGETRRQKVNRLIYSCDGTRFPGEPHINILPFVGKESKRDVLSHMAPKKKAGKKLRLFDMWKV